jgi:putative xylitol transport system ATP-binding protein
LSRLLLSMRGIQKSFAGVPALENGEIDLHAGEIHALCGGNGAGKSTFLSILMGFLEPDAGEICIDGQPVQFHNANEALQAGVAIVQQELSVIPHLTVAENIFLGSEPRKYGVLDRRMLRRQAEALLKSLGFEIDSDAVMDDLSIASQQLVEIAKALSHRNASIVIFDEPTSAIGEGDTQRLFAAIRGLAERDKGVIYVTHRLAEIFAIANTYTVFKDGMTVGSGKIADITREQLIELMIGGTLDSEFVKENVPEESPLLEVQGLAAKASDNGVTFTVRAGEVLGIYGLVGSGRTEILDLLYGRMRPERGTIKIQGRKLRSGDIADAIRKGVAYVTEDRKRTGLNLRASVGENLSISRLGVTSRLGFIDFQKERATIERAIAMLRIKTTGGSQAVRHLSGGNQQKTVLGRCAVTDPKVLLLDEPTRGVDVGAKKEIYRFISDFAKNGGGALMVSSDLEEVLGMCDRVLVLKKGDVVAEFAQGDATQQTLMLAAS